MINFLFYIVKIIEKILVSSDEKKLNSMFSDLIDEIEDLYITFQEASIFFKNKIETDNLCSAGEVIFTIMDLLSRLRIVLEDGIALCEKVSLYSDGNKSHKTTFQMPLDFKYDDVFRNTLIQGFELLFIIANFYKKNIELDRIDIFMQQVNSSHKDLVYISEQVKHFDFDSSKDIKDCMGLFCSILKTYKGTCENSFEQVRSFMLQFDFACCD